MARRRQKKTPEDLIAEARLARSKDLEAVNLSPDAANLARQEDIEIVRAGQGRGAQTVKADSARRLDAFEALRFGMVEGAYDAARRFEADVMIRRGENDRGRPTERVSRTAGFTTDAMVKAAQRIEQVLALLSPRDGWLLQELIAPVVDRGGWRDHAAYVTGEHHHHAQGAAVRACCVNLRDAYRTIERRAAA